jgi:UDP-N-acetylmuramyl pentapeptide synthase
VLLYGEEAKAIAEEMDNGRARHFQDKKQLIDFLSGKLHEEDIVLVKGSRAFGMDEIVEGLI